MAKIICNSIEFAFLSEIRLQVLDNVILKTGYDWKKLNVKEKPVYRSEINQADAGPVAEVSVTAVTDSDPDAILKQFSSFPIVLRMKTDKATFYVGSQEYPVITEISDDKIFDNYSFKCKSSV
ncbi:hypothetical protein SDC9_150933 [bioreactor metagenome]|uniref:Phage tail protein n=1 Tax=bioreactor metagenome TaxID=1076179 RepID=A0A645ENX1_9ZZZZ|nr:hypothetical protein [Proteiniphilum sp.]MEA4918137.1 hypothetical protein [Proteiniphilum sp.]